MPCSSLAFVWITETEHKVSLKIGYHVFLQHASVLYMHADLAIYRVTQKDAYPYFVR